MEKKFLNNLCCVIVLLCLINIGAAQLNPCAGVIDTTLVNDFSACDAYFVCTNGTGISAKCETGLYFEPTYQICLPANQVNCQLCLPGDLSLLQYHGSCAKYYVCIDGTISLRECANGLLFDTVQERCDFKENVICEGPICPLVTDPLNITVFPSPFTCSDYYICFNGSLLRRHCADGLHFNNDIQKCDFPANANCTLDQTEPEITEIACEPNRVEFVPHPTSCYHYFICTDSGSILLRCAPDLIFDYTKRQCNFREISICFSEL